MDPDRTKLKEMLTKMYLTRKFEETAADLFVKGAIHGTTHLYIGQEATATGVCLALMRGDMITSTHRGHGHCLSWGMDLNAMMAEFFGKATGCCKGRGGSMHMADIENGNLGENGVVGGGCGLAAGAALALKKKGTGGIVACFFGDGASNEGSFHEAANLASVWKLPVLFVCENNQYGMSMHISQSMNIDDIAVRADAYGFPAATVDGNDVVAVYQAAQKAREYVKNNGPMMLVCQTYRISGHSKSDTGVYRLEEEINEWLENDPIVRARDYMIQHGLTENELDAIDRQTTLDIENAVRFAQNSPDPSAETIQDGVYA